MRSLILILSLVIIPLSSAFASPEDKGYATRYKTKYRTWDPVFSSRYGYSEYDFASDCHYRTCYDRFDYHDDIWVEETVIEHGRYSGYTRVTVYSDSGYRDEHRYVSYYTHHGRVVRRHFHRPHRHVHRRVYVHRHYDHIHFSELDEFTQAIIVGAWFVDMGADVLAHCDSGDEGCAALGLASSVSGLAISISASINEHRKTELQQEIESFEDDDQEETLNDSLDSSFAIEE